MAYVKLENFRDSEVAAIIDLAKKDDKVVFLDADLSSCIGSTKFQQEFPDRFFNCGIAEANMVAVAAGLSSVGFKPYVHTFGCFASRRDYDQLFLSVGYAHQVIHLIGTDPGITAQYNGGTHMPFEDIALMRQIPNMTIIEPSDDYSLWKLTEEIHEKNLMSYTRIPRKGVVHRYTEGEEIVLGKGKELSDGEDVSIIALGALMVDAACGAADILAKKGIKATVIDLLSVKPFDEELILKAAKRTGRVLVCENGRYAGGIGEGIAAFLSKTYPVKMDFVWVGERYGEVGNLSYLAPAFGFTAENIAEKAEALAK